MCGRISVALSSEGMIQILRERYEYLDETLDLQLPNYNVAPSTNLLTVINDGKKYRVGPLRWGFVPFWAKDEKMGYNMINAKAETVSVKPAFRDSFKNKRCVILADGFYEWKKDPHSKIPYRFTIKDQPIIPFAGLWSSYNREDGEKLYTCTIITTTPNEIMQPIHDRMPVILTEENEKLWLNPNIADFDLLNSLLIPYESNQMNVYEVSSIVNNPRNKSAQCIEPLYS